MGYKKVSLFGLAFLLYLFKLSAGNGFCKTQSFYILFLFLLITITLLIAVGICCYLIKYQGKHLLPFHNTKFTILDMRRPRKS